MKITRFEVVLVLSTVLGIGWLVRDYVGDKEVPTQGLSGTIRFGGRPMPRGIVRFVSMDSLQCAAGSYVKNGRYEVPAELGLAPARYHVEFSSSDDETLRQMIAATNRGETFEVKEEVPERYNRFSEIEVDLSSGSVLEAHFDLK